MRPLPGQGSASGRGRYIRADGHALRRFRPLSSPRLRHVRRGAHAERDARQAARDRGLCGLPSGDGAQPCPAPVGDTNINEYVAAPAFAEIGKKFRHDGAGLRAFILAPDHPMREQTFVPRDLDDIVAYIQSLGR